MTYFIFGLRYVKFSVIRAIHSISSVICGLNRGLFSTILIDSLTLFISRIDSEVLLARGEVARQGKLFLGRHVMVSRNIHRRKLLGRLIVVRCFTVRRKCNLNAASRSGTHLALPIAGHRRIHCCLFPCLRRWAGLAGSCADNW